MRELVVGPFKSFVRIFAQVRKELIQVRRRPGAFFSLVLGPFLIMAVFGLGYHRRAPAARDGHRASRPT